MMQATPNELYVTALYKCRGLLGLDMSEGDIQPNDIYVVIQTFKLALFLNSENLLHSQSYNLPSSH